VRYFRVALVNDRNGLKKGLAAAQKAAKTKRCTEIEELTAENGPGSGPTWTGSSFGTWREQ